MRCPKCGFHSFDTLDACKKCSHDLREFKEKFGLRSLLFPAAAGAVSEADAFADSGTQPEPLLQGEDAATEEGSDFGFDFMGDESDAQPPAPAARQLSEEAAAFDDATGEQEDAFSLEADEEVPALDLDADWGEDVPALDEETAATAGPEEEEPFSFGQPWDEEVAGAPAAPLSGDESEALEAELDDFTFAPQDEELPALAAEADIDFPDSEELPTLESAEDALDWNSFAETLDAPDAGKKPGAGEEPNTPFDFRGAEAAARPPADSPAETDAQPNQDEPTPSIAGVFFSSLGETPEDEPESRGFDFAEEASAEPEPQAAEAELPWAAEGLPETLHAEYSVEEPSSLPGGESVPLPEVLEDPEAADAVCQAEEPATAGQGPTEGTLAPLLLRLGAGGLDLLVLALVFVLFLMAGELALGRDPQAGALPTAGTLLDLAGPYFLVLFALCFGYFTLFHFLAGQTPGKMFLRLRLEAVDGSPLSFSQAFLHSSGGLLCLLTGGVGFAAAGRHPLHQGWHDRIAATRVIRTRR
ncbi:hypothetical protein DESUT3_05800 [Desulfuromonas versatilis]|uniref:RDD domain-containing protein n=1 Tax=Desulfuromonas versatilis TaxID=2802975 RepID=A0ABN6DTP0_9BACT|nr:RDD family protein [Desulfuromonas versatilis]BCR03511.1 hypothetical protein DESUT3_05800 [Desulfuromonas versatilis]